MKKTVSINIGSIIFHIEEDGYERLKSYLDSISNYFSSFDDSQEIISDIESRIAEIFLNKLAGGEQTIHLEDVEELIATMGTTRDFKASIDEEEPEEESGPEESDRGVKKEPTVKPPKKLYRDVKRRILGGVASGIAYYIGIDPLWIRVLLIALLLNFFWGAEGISGAAFLGYIILWIVIPPNDKLEEDTKIKKLFRNPDDRVLGGVASGIASYFAADPVVVRLLFVLSIFLGGAGIFIYIILWIITPEAKTITQKMQMQGEPVTLSNIEDTVKKSLIAEEGEEKPLVKILLFPFRLIAIMVNGLGQLLGPFLKFLVEAIRVIFGAAIVVFGLVVMIGLIMVTATFLGLGEWNNWNEYFPLELIRDSISAGSLLSLFGLFFIPALAFSLLGMVVILRRRVANAYVGWSLFAIWVASLVISSFLIPSYVANFQTESEIRKEQTFEVRASTPTLKISQEGTGRRYRGRNMDIDFSNAELQLRGHNDSTYQLIVTIESRGRSVADAEENASQVIYNVSQEGNDIVFDPGLTYPQGSKFRFQEAQITFYIPYGKVFRMNSNLDQILVHTYGYRSYQLEDNDWVFEQTGLKCLTCTSSGSSGSSGFTPKSYRGQSEMSYPFEGFKEMKIASLFDVEITQGDEYTVRLKGSQEDLDEVFLNQVDDELTIRFRDSNWEWWRKKHERKIGLIITLPELQRLEISGACEGEVRGFDNEEMNLILEGASKLYVNADPENIYLSINGASRVELTGHAESLEVDLEGASGLEAFGFKTDYAKVDVEGASTAEIFATGELEVNASGVSTVRYKGTDNLEINKDGLSTVKRQ